jgi:SAM-dependent methyltransferase
MATMPALLHHRQASASPGWFDTPIAQGLLVEEQREVIPLLTAHIGVRGLYIRPTRSAPSQLSGNMLQRVTNLYQQGDGVAGDLRSDMPGLAIENDALCLVYALHTLDAVEAPEAVLDDLRRVLRPEGVLLLLGLSPTSAWRLRWMGKGITPHSANSMREMMARAGLKVELQAGIGSLLPALAAPAQPAAERSIRSLLDPLRASYLLVARKRRAGLTPISSPKRRPVGALQPQTRAGAG